MKLPEPMEIGKGSIPEAFASGWNACLEQIARLNPPVKDLNTLVAEKIRSEHIISYQSNTLLAAFECSCKARWNLGTPVTAERIRESMTNHHISVGLKPSEVL